MVATVCRPARLPPMALAWLSLWMTAAATLSGQDTSGVKTQGDSLTVRFVDTDLRAVIQSLAKFLDRSVLTNGIPGNRVTLETPQPVATDAAKTLLRGLIESQGLAWSEDSAFVRIGPKPSEPSRPARDGEGPTQGPVQLFVIRLKHANAADVAATINLLFGGGGVFAGGSGLSGGSLSDQLQQQQVPPPPQGLREVPPKPTQPEAPRSASLAGQVTLVPDALTNSILIRSAPEDYRVISAAVDQLDIRPLQVLIEVLIVEARKDRNFSFGADLFVPPQSVAGGTVSGQVRGGGIGDLVIRLMDLGKADIDATLRASESRGNVSILSRPVLLASNNTEARFLVGSQRPFVQVSRSLPTDTPSRDQVVQYKDVGTQLRVRPTINQDGYVSLIIRQEINAATNEVAFDAPVISTREAETQVLVRDGQTIVLGGLQDRQRDQSSNGVPILSGIPILGGLFGGTSRRTSTTELYLFLTPRILKTDDDVDRVTAPRLPGQGE